MVRRKTWIVASVAFALIVMAVGVALLWAPGRGAEPSIRLRPHDPEVTALGQKVYTAHCAACHGARLEGQPNWRERGPSGLLPAPPHDASGHTWHHPDEVLFRITRLGVARAANLKDYASAMPAYEGVLTDAEIIAVLSWIKAQWPADIRERHDEVNRAQAARKS